MANLIVVNKPKNWPLRVPNVEVVSARSYLAEPTYSELKGVRVFNLCRSYRYQSVGYYVSLLAEARGHKPIPSILTLQDMRSQTIARIVSEDLDETIQKSLAPLSSKRFTLSIYFGKNVARKYERLSLQFFNLFQVPLLRAEFAKQDRWELRAIYPIGVSDVPDSHRGFVVDAAADYFTKNRPPRLRRRRYRYSLAILHNPEEVEPPSDAKALARFSRAAEAVGLEPDMITKNDYAQLPEFDALFIRETTAVNHHTYRFARRAATEGLAVIDDPESIIRCTNKVYLAELFERRRIPAPKTVIVHKDNTDDLLKTLPMPCILKLPDSSFSQGVFRVEDPEELWFYAEALLQKSDLVIAQEFISTPFDWRVGVLDGKPLYVCKYHMAPRHWKILKKEFTGRVSSGRVETFAVEDAPRRVVRTAVAAADLIGDGLYGVDLKQVGRKCYVMEVNDNPSIDAGYEDSVLKSELYLAIMRSLLRRIERLKEA